MLAGRSTPDADAWLSRITRPPLAGRVTHLGYVPEAQREQLYAGARVVTSTLLGKGVSMEDGIHEAQNEFIVYLDGDLRGLREDLIERMAAPLLSGYLTNPILFALAVAAVGYGAARRWLT